MTWTIKLSKLNHKKSKTKIINCNLKRRNFPMMEIIQTAKTVEIEELRRIQWMVWEMFHYNIILKFNNTNQVQLQWNNRMRQLKIHMILSSMKLTKYIISTTQTMLADHVAISHRIRLEMLKTISEIVGDQVRIIYNILFT